MARSGMAPRRPGESTAVAAGGAAVALGLAAALVTVRGTIGPANAALLITIVVVIAAIGGGRIAGGVSGVVGALSFNFFFTHPYLTLRVNDGRDIATVVLIVVIGLIVGQLTNARARQKESHEAQSQSLHSIEQVAALVSSGAEVDTVWTAIHAELLEGLHLTDARWERADSAPWRATVQRDGHIDVLHHVFTGNGFALPRDGVQVPVIAEGRPRGQIVLEATPTTTVTIAQRRAVVALADQLAAALAASDRAGGRQDA